MNGLAPQRLFMLTDRLERLKRSRWQWFAMVLLLFVMRKQIGTPLLAEFTALAQFIVFLALPDGSMQQHAAKPLREVLRRS